MTPAVSNLFGDNVEEAVQSSLQKNRALFIFLTREDEESRRFYQQYMSLDDDEDNDVEPQGGGIRLLLEQHFVCLKIVERSLGHDYLRQVVPNLQLPSFSILSKGAVKGMVTKDTARDQFREMLIQLAEQASQASQASHEEAASSADGNVSGECRPATDNLGELKLANFKKPGSSSEESVPNLEHEETVKRHRIQAESLRKSKQEELARIRALLEADKRERKSRSMSNSLSEGLHRPELQKATAKMDKGRNHDQCILSIKLFDGSTLRHDFKASETLRDVRGWLDAETDNQLIPSASSLPAFATSSYPQATHYVFHRPMLPRITYDETAELKSLHDLDLCPRSVLLLKKVYESDSNSTNAQRTSSTGLVKSLGSSVGRFCNALYSFFDYSVDFPGDIEESDDTDTSDRSKTDDGRTTATNKPEDSSQSGKDLPSPRSKHGDEHCGLTRESNSATPNILSIANIDSMPPPCIRENPRPTPREVEQPTSSANVTANVTANSTSRTSTPQPSTSAPSLINVQTIHHDIPEKNEPKEKHKDKRSYEGSSYKIKDSVDEL